VEQATGAKAVLYGLSFPDATHGWACGDNGTILQIVTQP
jgi:hypothetical protein